MEGPRVTLATLMGEKLRQKVHQNMPKQEELKICSVVQLATEIEAIKKQERALMSKRETQEYVEQEMEDELADLQMQLEDN